MFFLEGEKFMKFLKYSLLAIFLIAGKLGAVVAIPAPEKFFNFNVPPLSAAPAITKLIPAVSPTLFDYFKADIYLELFREFYKREKGQKRLQTRSFLRAAPITRSYPKNWSPKLKN